MGSVSTIRIGMIKEVTHAQSLHRTNIQLGRVSIPEHPQRTACFATKEEKRGAAFMSRDGAKGRVVSHYLSSNRGRCRRCGPICCSRHVPRRRKRAVGVTKRAGGDTPVVLTAYHSDQLAAAFIPPRRRGWCQTNCPLAEITADHSDPFSNHRRQRPVLLALLPA